MTEWLLGTLLATSVLTVVVLLVREPVRRRFGSRVAYGLWLIPAARLFMPTLTHSVERTIPAQVAFHPLAGPLAREPLWMSRVAPADLSLIDRLAGWPVLLLALWLIVAAGLFLKGVIAFYRDRRAILVSSTCVGKAGSIRIIRSPEIASPVALGILDRVIAVPSDFERLYGTRERRLVLEHELSHHRSGDLIANLFAFALLCLQWFNPLAWVAHAAFRFDQEAACDARVLDTVRGRDRADYGRAIAKAASGRALLFASALDHRHSLHRRLQSMLRNPDPGRRLAGRLMVFGVIAVALPLTASRAVHYVDLPAARAAPVAPLASAVLTAAQPLPAVASGAAPAAPPVREPAVAASPAPAVRAAAATAAPGPDADLTISGDLVTIDGTTKRWEDLTPAEKAEVQRAVAKARTALAKAHLDQAQLTRDLAAIPSRVQIDALQRQLARLQATMPDVVRRIDDQADAIRWSGRDPEQIKAAVRKSLQTTQNVDWDAVARTLAPIDPQKIAKSAQQSIRAAQAELDRLDGRIRADKQR